MMSLLRRQLLLLVTMLAFVVLGTGSAAAQAAQELGASRAAPAANTETSTSRAGRGRGGRPRGGFWSGISNWFSQQDDENNAGTADTGAETSQAPEGQASFADEPDPPADGACNYFSPECSNNGPGTAFPAPDRFDNVGVSGNYTNSAPSFKRDKWKKNTGGSFGATGIDCKGRYECGGTTDPKTEAVCTPFPVRRTSLDGGGCCTGDCFKPQFDDSMIKSLGGPDGALAWQADGASDYRVFHGCDGAGLQTDCKGDSYYVEHYVDRCPGGFGPGCDCDIFSTDIHNQCPFTHPGTGATSKFYSCGWWNDGGVWPDYGFDWWKNNGAGLDPKGKSGQAWPDFAFTVYPWVCHKDTSRDFSYFGTPSNVNCLCDNEPLQDFPPDPSCTFNPNYCQPPPAWYAYKAWWEKPFVLKVHGGLVGAQTWDTFYLKPLAAPPY